jgi:hypothetical protein
MFPIPFGSLRAAECSSEVRTVTAAIPAILITCPKCAEQFPLTESLAAPLVAEKQKLFEAQIEQARETAREEATQKARAALQTELQGKDMELEASKATLVLREEEIRKARQKEIEVLQRESEVKRRESEIELERQEIGAKLKAEFQEQLTKERATATEEATRKVQAAIQTQLQGKDIEIETARATLVLREEEIRKARQREIEVLQRESEIARKESEIELERQQIESKLRSEFQERIKQERTEATNDAFGKAKGEAQLELAKKDQEIAQLEQARVKSSQEAVAAQAELKRKERELKLEKEKMDIAIQTAVNEQLDGVQLKALKDSEARHRLKLAEKDRDISEMKHQIEELQRKAEESSQQRQGEIQELELERVLSVQFPTDTILPVAKGISGADVTQRVANKSGQLCGTIIWESKRTKTWGENWLPKLRGEQRQANADAAILVSETLPKNVDGFGLVNGVWVTEFRYLVPVATAIRSGILEVAAVRTLEEGQQTKKDLVYKYLTGQQFRQRVQAIVEVFGEMQEELERERRSATRQFAKRDEQIRRIVDATSGMYGDLQGIAGRTLSAVEGLELPPPAKRPKTLEP